MQTQVLAVCRELDALFGRFTHKQLICFLRGETNRFFGADAPRIAEWCRLRGVIA